MRRWERANVISRHWHRVGIEHGIYLSDVEYMELAQEERQRLYQEAYALTRRVWLVPVRGKDGWRWVEHKYRY
jgi:hypothetical protein